MNKLTNLVAGLLVVGSAANAGIILNWGNGSTSSNDPLTGASAEAILSFTDVGSVVQISVAVDNTTGDSALTGGFDTNGDPIGAASSTDSKLTAVGFDLWDPNTGISNFVAGSFLDTLIEGGSIAPFGTIEFAAADNGNLLGGNANGALAEDDGTDTFSFDLNGTGLGAADLEAAFLAGFQDGSLEFFTRFQQVDPGGRSDKLLGGTATSTNPTDPGNPGVPEPSTYAMFGMAFLMLGFAGYRSRNRKS